MSQFTYRPIVQRNGEVAYLRVEVTEATAYSGMPVFPRVGAHTGESGSRVPSITQHLLDREHDSRMRKLRAETEAAERPVKSSTAVTLEATPTPDYCRVIDID